MSLLTQVMAKGLALADYVLGYFVTVTPTAIVVGDPDCGYLINVWNTAMEPCGTQLIDNALKLVQTLLVLAPDLLEGLFAIK